MPRPEQTSWLPPVPEDAALLEQIRCIIDRVESLERDRAALGDEIRMVYRDARRRGLDVKALRKIIALRREERATIDRYLAAAMARDE